MRAPRRPRVSSPASSTSSKSVQLVQRLVLTVAGIASIVTAFGFVYFMYLMPVEWNEQTAKNIVIVPQTIDVPTNSILYATISYKQDKISLQSLPAEDMVQVPGGYGQYPLKSVYPLLQLEKKPPQVVAATYSFLIGVPIDEVWVSSDAQVFEPEQTAQQFAEAVLWNRMSTGLGIKDRWTLAQFIKAQQPVEQVFASMTDWQAKQTSRFAGQLKDCRVALVNTTSVAGLGRKVSTVLERSGVVVVRLTDSTPAQPKSTLTIQPDQPDCVQFAEHVTQLFPEQIEVQVDPQILTRTRSEAEIVIGDDLGTFLAN